ncbi:1-acyl-sn-glycerol-3-phosphate acyltransferase [Aureisphaera sp. CAU 1614]|uniref:1-acyl-sn-glycerol-3-phosphate acyltransferase n=1 Tax=Halomarinibacterium sedimenti TaxID=2857106 RepID=A0A9X1FP27_9FLAO|nr:lysophospholipid acyltransferase family protein [Halomarinibacterium sedimenti]MBW2937197.1 1-acyl-sn-glycerol-3-phosphate acyltransferase [Halomarinibacterium sedimenti]
MKILKYPLLLFYRIWFYILVTVPILVLFPILLLSISKESWYPYFFRLARFWSKIILFGMGFIPIIKRDLDYEEGKSYMFVANHTSMTDIMLMLYASKNPFVFVGKMELAKIPLFGFFYKRTCILVDRDNPKSRREVFKSAQEKLNQGLSVCIFPEGGVPDESILLDEFKDGAFRLAIEHKIPIAPMTFHDNKKRFSYTFFSGSPGKMRVKIHKIIPTGILEMEDKRMLRMQTRELILNELNNPTV